MRFRALPAEVLEFSGAAIFDVRYGRSLEHMKRRPAEPGVVGEDCPRRVNARNSAVLQRQRDVDSCVGKFEVSDDDCPTH